MESCGSFCISENDERKKTLQFSDPRKEEMRGDEPPHGTGAFLDQEALSLYMFTYTARESAEAGLMYYRARYYSSNTGRFVTEDPLDSTYTQLGFKPRGKNMKHVYIYPLNNPIKWSDPSGMDAGPKDGPCDYYDRKCAETGCQYPCGPGKKYCESDGSILNAADDSKTLTCIRECLQEADKSIRTTQPMACFTCQCPYQNCINEFCIANYHKKCFIKCKSKSLGVAPWIPHGFPGGGPMFPGGGC